jgi:hypothetical protein
MVARIGEWIELSFWQMAVRVLSGARPFSHGLQKVQHSIALRPIARVFANGWLIAGAGWVIGLILGIMIAGWI